MDPETANELFKKGAIAVFLNVPTNTEFGIDLHTWRTGDKFKGVKMIPPGLHMIHYSAVNREDVAPRTSFFHYFSAGEMFVRVWDPATEDLVAPSDENLQERLGCNKLELDRYLAAIPAELCMKWSSLISCIDEELMQRLQPKRVKFSSVSELECDHPSRTPEDRANCSSSPSSLPEMHVKSGTEFRFSKIPQSRFPEDASPTDKTKYSIDSSFVVSKLFDSMESRFALLGELQVAFVAFLVGHVYDAFEHWKTLVNLVCTCDEALREYPDFFMKFITCFHYQIKEVPDSFFTDIVSKENFLVNTLYVFFSNLCEADIHSNLKEKGNKFRGHLERKFGLDFSSEPDDYAPALVETT